MASAMQELQRMLKANFGDDRLLKKNGTWDVWHLGEDWGKSPAEIAVLEAQKAKDEDYFERSNAFMRVETESDGAIRGFRPIYSGELSDPAPVKVFMQFVDFVTRSLDSSSAYQYADGFDFDLQPNGSMIDVDVVLLEINMWNHVDAHGNKHHVLGGGELTIGTPFRVVIGQFTYNPERDVLLHRV